MSLVCKDANPDVIKWCRNEVAGKKREAAKRLKIDESVYTKIEQGEVYPTFSQLKKLAELYKRPVASFFLPEPPGDTVKPKDYRSHRGNLSRKTLLSIRRSRFIQKNYLHLESKNKLQQKLWRHNTDISRSAEEFRRWLNITDELQAKNLDISKFFDLLIDRLEAKGILVLLHSFPRDDAKAYSLAEIPRIITITTNDNSVGSRIFSLLHELCHIRMGDSGICYVHEKSNQYQKERVCDRFATYSLMPESLVRKYADEISPGDLLDNDNLDYLSRRLKSSKLALLIRLSELGYIKSSQIEDKKDEWKSLPIPKTGFGVTTRATKAVKENGAPYVTKVLSAYSHNEVSASDASKLLGVNHTYFEEVGAKVGQK